MDAPLWTAAILCCSISTAAWAVPAESSGLHLQVRLQGHGARTVIFEAGAGDTMDVWKQIQPQVAAGCSRTLAYNRAGYEGSDAASQPRDSASIVAELRAELKRRNINPPYVLVGHSLGGLYMQYFARNYPGEVVGLVLVDSTHWNQGLSIDGTANTPYWGRSSVTLFMPWIMRRELTDSATAGQQVHASPAADYLPTIVLSRAPGAPTGTSAARLRDAELQDEIARDFPEAQHIEVSDSGHYIQRDRPELVVAAARELAGCSAGKLLPHTTAAADSSTPAP
jgi:pimeloyl-ACP methyl ester carboxylesterase